jgi:kinetochore protein Mis12/MTW1
MVSGIPPTSGLAFSFLFTDTSQPWHSGIDFDRAKFVTTLPGGEATLADRLTSLRDQVEQARLVRHRLALAEAELDRRLEITAHRRAEVGFVHDGVEAAGLAPLPTNAQAMTAALMGLHDRIKDVDVPMGVGVGAAAAVSGGGVGGGDGTGGKWEAGRQAYLSWAVDKALAKGVGDGALDGAERAAKAVGSVGDMDALARVVQ